MSQLVHFVRVVHIVKDDGLTLVHELLLHAQLLNRPEESIIASVISYTS